MPYILPADINPTDRIYACVPIPNDPMHRAAFMGQMTALSRWYSWERDDAHTGKDVAAVWRDIIDNELSLSDAPCVDPQCPSAFLYVESIPGVSVGFNQSENYWQSEDCASNHCDGGTYTFFGWASPTILDVFAEVGCVFRDDEFNSVGINVCEIRAEPLVGGGWDALLKWEDCLGQVHTQNFAKPPSNSVNKFDFAAKWLYVRTDNPFFWTVRINGPILCGPA